MGWPKIPQYIERGLETVIFSLIGISATAGLAQALANYYPGTNSSTVASWFQGVGTIIAVIAAVLLGERQATVALRNAQKVELEAIRRRHAATMAICDAAKKRVEDIKEIFSGEEVNSASFYGRYDKSILNSIIAALSAIPVHEIGSAGAVIAMLDLRDRLGFLRDCIERFKDGPTDWETEHRMNDGSRQKMVCHNVRYLAGVIDSHYADLQSAMSKL